MIMDLITVLFMDDYRYTMDTIPPGKPSPRHRFRLVFTVPRPPLWAELRFAALRLGTATAQEVAAGNQGFTMENDGFTT